MQARLILRLAGIGAALSLLGASSPLVTSSDAAYVGVEHKFCEGDIAHDYARPFSKMPPARPLPSSGRLPFLPEHVRLSKPGQATLVLGGYRDLLYDLSVPSGSVLPRRVDLWAKARLSEVNARGKTLRVVRRADFRINAKNPIAVDEQRLLLELPSKVGFFRTDLDFTRTDGSRLGRYREYFRSVRPQLRTRIHLARDTVGVGDRLFFRVANIGTRPVAFGEGFRVEAKDGERWSRIDLTLGPWQRVRLGLGPGEAGKCQSFSIPDGLVPNGTYRLVKDLLTPSVTIASGKFTVVP